MKTAYLIIGIIAVIALYVVYKQGGFRRLGTRETGTSSVYTSASRGEDYIGPLE